MTLRNVICLSKLRKFDKLPQINFRTQQHGIIRFETIFKPVVHHRNHTSQNLCFNNYHNYHNKFIRRNYSRYSASTIMSDGGIFCLDDYHIIGFDLDNTLACYNLPEMINLEYEVLAEYLVQYKGYSKEILKPISSDDIDFLQRGLLLDAKRKNLLKISCDGTILKASHGTRFMSDEEIEKIYGSNRCADIVSQYVDEPMSTWNGPASEEIRAFLDYFDVPAALVVARAVDIIDRENMNSIKPKSYEVWLDVLEALIHMYRREAFAEGSSRYFEELKAEPERYIMKVNPKVIEWLKELKKTKAIYLLTGSNIDFSELVASNAIGPNWKNLFDVVVTYARKPGFFIGARPFYEILRMKETCVIDESSLKLNNVYSQGNWKDLKELLKQKFNIKNPQCLYIGDNLMQDIYTPSKFINIDTVSIVNEIDEENTQTQNMNEFNNIITSKKWGSYFELNHKPTFWTDIILNHSKICITKIDYLAERSITQKYECFKNDICTNIKGFYPLIPKTLSKVNS